MPYTLPLRQKLWCFTIYYLISTPYIHRTMNTPKYFWIFLILSFLIPLCNPFAFAIAYICFAHAPHPLCVSAVWFGGGESVDFLHLNGNQVFGSEYTVHHFHGKEQSSSQKLLPGSSTPKAAGLGKALCVPATPSHCPPQHTLPQGWLHRVTDAICVPCWDLSSCSFP